MISLHRCHVFARPQVTCDLALWSRTLQRDWSQPSILTRSGSQFSTTCLEAVSSQCLTPTSSTRGFQPQPLPLQGASHFPIVWLPPRGIRVGRFTSGPSSAQAKRPRPSQRVGSQSRSPKGLPPPVKDRPAPRRMPAVATSSRPIEARLPTAQALPTPKEHTPPHFNSTRSAVHCIICINVAIWVIWRHCNWQQPCVHEQCEDDDCGHELCDELQWMLNNTTTSSSNLSAHRYWTLVTASFSHMTHGHLLSNVLGFAIFAPTFYTAGGLGIGASHVMRLTIGSAVFSNLASLVYRRDGPRNRPEVTADEPRKQVNICGASGVVGAFATAATCLTPGKCPAIGRFTLPFPMLFITVNLILCDMVMLDSGDDTAHEAHLAGHAFGIAYYLFVLRKSYGWRRLVVV